MKKIIILGSTGSIGVQALEVIANHMDKFRVVGLSTNKNTTLLAEQVGQFSPEVVVIADEAAGKSALDDFSADVEINIGKTELPILAAHPEADIVLNALVGGVGLESTIAVLKAGKTLALANKESMVMGGQLIRSMVNCQLSTNSIIPVDSEHSAIFQCLLGEDKNEVRRLILTSSGGPFRKANKEEMDKATVEQALAHPRWNMGQKISIDSATLMNKGLEVIEAHFLFDIGYKDIEVVVHPQSIIHSMVEYCDGSIKAHLGQTDMKIPIQYAISYPQRWPSPMPYLDFVDVGRLDFEPPDTEKFPCLKLAYEAAKLGQTFPTALNAANEVAVEHFLSQNLDFRAITTVIEKTLEDHQVLEATNLENVLQADKWARDEAKRVVERLKC
ncbi:MAG: 1-deoxy-D-xylulose-5-phosphate reductoisomerase [Actinobacteria bacterium]|nr:MAG: 1-deoxy-D-xylulose-5-phosphate reductoisomerase [Actinomycetota bacterium]